jgi:hypothetical protein
MATTGAVLYIKPRAFVTVSARRRTGASLYISARFLSGLYSTTGVTASTNSRNRKVFPPSVGDAIGYVMLNGQRLPVLMDEQFRRFLVDEIHERRLGGSNGATISDIETTVTTTQEQAATVSAVVTGVSQQVAQNAEAAAVLREAAVTAGVASSTALPPFQLTNQLER